MVVDMIPELPNFLTNIAFQGQVFLDSLHLAQAVRDPDVIGQMQAAFNNFIRSGQVWALGIGFVLGYLIRGVTA